MTARVHDTTDATHPEWCVGGHRCTASWRTDGEHVSPPEVWITDLGRIVATRYRSGDARRDHVEVTVSAHLNTADEGCAQSRARAVIATVYAAINWLAGLETAAPAQANPTDLKGHLR